MRDRQPTQPGRVLLTPENGNPPFYAVMEMADNPTDQGTPPTKANLLTDETEISLFGDAADRTVNQALAGIGFRFKMIADAMATVTVAVKDGSGVAAKDVLVAGMFGETGEAVYTNESGVASGYVAEGSVTLKISGYADMEDVSDTFTAVAGGSYDRTITITRRTYLKLTSSKSLRFSGNVATVDVALGGGGASGQNGQGEYGSSGWAARYAIGGKGGGAGEVAERTGIVPDSRTVYAAVIGAGGAEGGNAGGVSSFLGVSAAGGKVGAGGIGGTFKPVNTDAPTTASTAGADGTGSLYKSMTETFLYGGAGGGGAAASSTRTVNGIRGYAASSSGGYPGGGKGGETTYGGGGFTNGEAGTNGLGGGGGGGASEFRYGGANYSDSVANSTGAKGGSGCITMRIHLAA